MKALVGSAYGNGQGTFLMDEVKCAGTESSLEFCNFPGWGVSDCLAGESAGVLCNSNKTGEKTLRNTVAAKSNDFNSSFKGCGKDKFVCTNGKCIDVRKLQ